MAVTETPEKRSRGRPRKTVAGSGAQDGVDISRELVLETAVEMTKTERLDDVSFVQIARKLGVTPGSVHYYVGKREELISSVLNQHYKKIWLASENIATYSDWREGVRDLMIAARDSLMQYPGIASYITTRSQNRLFQSNSGAQIDYGREYINRILAFYRDVGFTPENTAICLHLQHTHVVSHSTGLLEGNLPHQSADNLTDKFETELELERPRTGLVFGLKAMAEIDADYAFRVGVDALLDKFTSILKKQSS